jgi:hypothetical protein
MGDLLAEEFLEEGQLRTFEGDARGLALHGLRGDQRGLR